MTSKVLAVTMSLPLMCMGTTYISPFAAPLAAPLVAILSSGLGDMSCAAARRMYSYCRLDRDGSSRMMFLSESASANNYPRSLELKRFDF
jgi:hypothetical protein